MKKVSTTRMMTIIVDECIEKTISAELARQPGHVPVQICPQLCGDWVDIDDGKVYEGRGMHRWVWT